MTKHKISSIASRKLKPNTNNKKTPLKKWRFLLFYLADEVKDSFGNDLLIVVIR